MQLDDLPLVNSKDIKVLFTKEEAIILSIRDCKGYVLNDLAFKIFKLINGKNNIRKIISSIIKIKRIDKKEIINILKELKEEGFIYFRFISRKESKLNENFFTFLNKWSLEKKIPYYLTIELTKKCNFNCIHCYLEKKNIKKELSFNEIKRVLKEASEMGVSFLGITGGEPFLRKDIIPILEYAAEQKFIMYIKTNGSLITEKEVEKLKDLPIMGIDISIYGSNREEYKRVTGSAIGFDKTMKSLSILEKTSIPITLGNVLLKENFKSANKIRKIANRMGFNYGNNKNIIPIEGKNFESLNHVCSIDEYLKCNAFKVDSDTAKEFLKLKADIKEESSLCGAGHFSIVINSFGDIYPCVEWRESCGNIRKKSIKEILNSSKKLKWIKSLKFKDFKNCHNCELNTVCGLCTYRALNCEDWVKEQARNFKKIIETYAKKDNLSK